MGPYRRPSPKLATQAPGLDPLRDVAVEIGAPGGTRLDLAQHAVGPLAVELAHRLRRVLLDLPGGYRPEGRRPLLVLQVERARGLRLGRRDPGAREHKQ